MKCTKAHSNEARGSMYCITDAMNVSLIQQLRLKHQVAIGSALNCAEELQCHANYSKHAYCKYTRMVFAVLSFRRRSRNISSCFLVCWIHDFSAPVGQQESRQDEARSRFSS